MTKLFLLTFVVLWPHLPPLETPNMTISKEDLDRMGKVAEILKRRFPNLTVQETLELAGEIMSALAGF